MFVHLQSRHDKLNLLVLMLRKLYALVRLCSPPFRVIQSLKVQLKLEESAHSPCLHSALRYRQAAPARATTPTPCCIRNYCCLVF